MDRELKEQFIVASIRFQKVDICFLAESDIHFGEFVVMEKIVNNGGCPGKCLNVSDIQDKLYISKPAVSQILNSLEKKGYILRNINPEDRRKVTVTATPQGKAELEKAVACYDHTLDNLCSEYGAADMNLLIEQLNRLIDVYEQMKQERSEK